MEQLHGLLVVNKPRGLSSAQCTNRLKRLGQRKIGHAGTLDPMAQGVLLMLLGHATKISGHLMAGGEKTYSAVVEFGRSTDTWDDEGTDTAVALPHIFREEVLENPDFAEELRRIVSSWEGVSEQIVPSYSAAKHEGKTLYSLARAGKVAPEKTKFIEISRAEILWVDLPRAAFRVTCSSGTYIRSLAHSLGTRLGCGAVLTELTREYSHPFGLDRAHSLDSILDQPERLSERVISVAEALPLWSRVNVPELRVPDLKNGIPLPAEPPVWSLGTSALLLSPQGDVLALASGETLNQRPVWSIIRGLWPST